MSFLSKLMYRLNTISQNPSKIFIIDSEKNFLMFVLNSKRNIIATTIWKKKSQVGEIVVSNFKTHYTVRLCGVGVEQTHRSMQQDRGPRNHLMKIYLHFDKGAKACKGGIIAFSINGSGEIQHPQTNKQANKQKKQRNP